MPFEVSNHIGDEHYVHMGSKICLRHLATGRYIRSSARNYPGGSQEQIVYAAGQNPEHEDWWQVIAPYNQASHHGQRIPYGGQIRIYHMATFKFLRSHNINSPVTGQLEVSTGGQDDQTNDDEIWIVEKADNGSGEWHANDQFLLIHKNTGAYLHSHDIAYDAGNEVTAFRDRRDDVNNVLGTRFG